MYTKDTYGNLSINLHLEYFLSVPIERIKIITRLICFQFQQTKPNLGYDHSSEWVM